MTNVMRMMNDECRIKELYPYLINPKSDIPILTIRIPQSDFSDFPLQQSVLCPLTSVLCPLPSVLCHQFTPPASTSIWQFQRSK